MEKNENKTYCEECSKKETNYIYLIINNENIVEELMEKTYNTEILPEAKPH